MVAPVPGGGVIPWSWAALILLLLLGAGIVVYILRRLVARPVTGAEVFLFYLRAAMVIGLALAITGGAALLKVGFAQAFGDEFSYGGGFTGYASGSCSSVQGSIQGSIAVPAAPGPGVVPAPALTPGEGSRLRGPTPLPAPTSGVSRPTPRVDGAVPCPFPGPRPAERNLTGQKQADALQGAALLALGTALAGSHVVMRRRLERVPAPGAVLLRRAENMVGVVLFGVAAFAGLSASLPGALDRWLKVADGRLTAPGMGLGVGLLSLGIWIYYLRAAMADLGPPAAPSPPVAGDPQ
jgi:hypothetical protein